MWFLILPVYRNDCMYWEIFNHLCDQARVYISPQYYHKGMSIRNTLEFSKDNRFFFHGVCKYQQYYIPSVIINLLIFTSMSEF